VRPYIQRDEDMVRSQKNTLLVDFRHVLEYDQTLAEAIEVRYFRYGTKRLLALLLDNLLVRYEPYLRRAIQQVVAKHHPDYIALNSANDRDKALKGKEFFLSVYGVAGLLKCDTLVIILPL